MRRRTSRAFSLQERSAGRSPGKSSTEPRSLRPLAVSEWCSPSVVRLCARTSSKQHRASGRLPSPVRIIPRSLTANIVRESLSPRARRRIATASSAYGHAASGLPMSLSRRRKLTKHMAVLGSLSPSSTSRRLRVARYAGDTAASSAACRASSASDRGRGTRLHTANTLSQPAGSFTSTSPMTTG
jgi:hypothetical protein